MNANPAFAAAVAPALDASDSRAPEPTRERGRVRVRDRVGVTSLENFDVYRVSLDACRACAPIAAALTAILKDQLLRASSSVVLNIAEAMCSQCLLKNKTFRTTAAGWWKLLRGFEFGGHFGVRG